MKRQPNDKKPRHAMQSSKLAAGGFMGNDDRDPACIIAEDAGTLDRLGIDARRLAERMRALTSLSIPALGGWVKAAENLKVRSEDFKGLLVCPWSHTGKYDKRITTAQRLDSAKTITWSDLNIHLIEEHGFFEGKGSPFRLEPEELAGVLF